MAWKDCPVDDFEGFVGALRSLVPSGVMDDHVFWFRGQSNEHWPLQPSFNRGLRNTPLEDWRAIERLALRTFQSQAHMYVSAPLLAKVQTAPCWWALMQHHGAPTRLLDWSGSPYVAAYFAVHHEGEAANGVVWCCCRKLLRAAAERGCGIAPAFEDPSAPAWYENALNNSTKEVVIPLEFNFVSSERCAAQQGKFTMALNVGAQHDGIIGQVADGYARKIIIPHAQKSAFLLHLREMNITGAALFPGVDGLGQSVKELVSLGTLCRRLKDENLHTKDASAGQQ
jgi:hypothetical protein